MAVVALLALLLGGAGATLAWLAADRGDDGTPQAAAGSATTSTTSDADDPTSSSSSTSSTRPAGESEGNQQRGNQSTGNRSTGNQSQNNQSGGQTVVGNGVFTGSYQGNSDRSTDAFTVGDGWKIRWEVPEGAVTIAVFNAVDEVVETIQARGQGELVVNEGGTYRLDISTEGSRYTVAVTDGP